ncbi:MAG: MoxR family ATPase [Desulfobacterales bacterium]|nr:MoxR family ATPase [Desulfobacterales bacterium]
MNKQFEEIVSQIGKVILGKEEQIRLALTCLFAKGHLLIEDIPGIGKTTLAHAISKSLGLNFCRIQCTSDMLPSDILGVSVFDQKISAFVFHPGPIFTNVLLTDEINRTTPKTQSALLEAMEERQVTVEGKTRILDNPFFVIATQNPLEQAGTFPLPESQLDRFLMRINIGYPDANAERELLKIGETKKVLNSISSVLSPGDVIKIQDEIPSVFVSDALIEYVYKLLSYTRTSSYFFVGLSPRAGLSLLCASKSRAFFAGRNFVLPEDVQYVLTWVTSHRLKSRDDLQEFSHEKLRTIFSEVSLP